MKSQRSRGSSIKVNSALEAPHASTFYCHKFRILSHLLPGQTASQDVSLQAGLSLSEGSEGVCSGCVCLGSWDDSSSVSSGISDTIDNLSTDDINTSSSISSYANTPASSRKNLDVQVWSTGAWGHLGRAEVRLKRGGPSLRRLRQENFRV